jgi:heptosyltransferase I
LIGCTRTSEPTDQCLVMLTQPPKSICLLRLSAIGDTCHVVPLVRTLQHAWPATRLTWVIGRNEHRLMRLMTGVEFITIDKRAMWRSMRELRAALAGRRFDALLHLQPALRASLYSLLIRARLRVGLDRARARELQWLFTNRQIAARRHQHSQELCLEFATALGISEHRLSWDLPLPAEARDWAESHIPAGRRTMVVSPCSSKAVRNWLPDRYAAVIDHAVNRHGLQVLLCSSPAVAEKQLVAEIAGRVKVPVTNLAGRDTLPQLLALLGRATVLLTPDSGPAHMGTMAGVPVIGLHAATRAARTGPYLSQQWCVDRYEQAAQRFRGRPAADLKWTANIENEGVMELITVEDVTRQLDALLQAHPA